MPSLPQVLQDAISHDATEITLESGQAPMIRTEAGSRTVGPALDSSDLFEALSEVLGPEQQAELAVGHMIEFHIESPQGRWTLVTEPSADGIVVRGRRAGAAAPPTGIGLPLDLPPLEPFEPEGLRQVPHAPHPVFRAAQQPTRREIGGVEQPLGAQWLESNVFEAAVASADDGSAIDFELRAPGARYDEDPTELEPRRSSAPSPVSVKGFTPRSPKIRSPHRGLTRNDRSDRRMFAELAASMVLPMLCIVQGEGNAERLAACIDEGTFRTINDDDDDAAMLAAAREVAGGTFVVRLEDPSRVLGWILRRLEEGSTVVVQTRARTMEGAHRTLLGLAVTPGAEAWLAVHRVGWLHENGSGDWTLALRNG